MKKSYANSFIYTITICHKSISREPKQLSIDKQGYSINRQEKSKKLTNTMGYKQTLKITLIWIQAKIYQIILLYRLDPIKVLIELSCSDFH